MLNYVSVKVSFDSNLDATIQLHYENGESQKIIFPRSNEQAEKISVWMKQMEAIYSYVIIL